MAFTFAQPLYGQTGSYTAQQDRLLVAANAVTAGVQNAPSATTGDLAVATTGLATATVTVAAGNCWVPGASGQGSYYAYNDAAITVTIAANGTGSTRFDYIYVLVTDPNVTTGLPNVTVATLQGTAGGGTPTLPSSNALGLAVITVPAGFTSGSTVSAGNISDRRYKAQVPEHAVPAANSTYIPSPSRGNVVYDAAVDVLKSYSTVWEPYAKALPAGWTDGTYRYVPMITCTAANRAALTGMTAGLMAYETDTLKFYTYDGSAWIIGAEQNAWDTWTPTVVGVTAGTGATTQYRYTQINKMVHFRFQITFGTAPSFTAPVTFTLPVTPATSAVPVAQGYYNGTGGPWPISAYYISSVMALYYNKPTATLNTNVGQGAVTTGATPVAPASGNILVISGTYEAA